MVCKLCLTELINKRSFVVEDTIREVLPTINLDMGLSNNCASCIDCYTKLIATYDFKTMCLKTEGMIITSDNYEKGSNVDLSEVYMKKTLYKKSVITPGEQVCRLCLELANDEYKPLEVFDSNMVDKYIPELNFSITNDPVMCRKCFDSLGIHIDFLRKCLSVIENGKDTTKDAPTIKVKEETVTEFDELDEDRKFSLQAFDQQIFIQEVKQENYIDENENSGPSEMKSDSCYAEENSLNMSSSCCETQQNPKFETKKESQNRNGSSEIKKYSCDQCGYQTVTKKHFVQHQIKHKDPSELTMYSCDKCDFVSRWKRAYTEHQIKHADPSELKTYNCDKCDYQTTRKRYLVEHRKIHGDRSKLKRHSCDKCDYRTTRRKFLVRHQKVHKNPPKLKSYKCDKCPYQATKQHQLLKHQMVHMDPSELTMYHCDKCDYVTKWKTRLPVHQLIHKDPSELKMYRCDKCDFKTKRKTNLAGHQMKHKDPSELKMYHCDKCNYKTKKKHYLPKHQINHKDPSDVKMYKCDECNYQSAHRNLFNRHLIIHRDSSQLQMHRCDRCHYETKYKAHLQKHQLKHRNECDVKIKMYKCDKCEYETMWQGNFSSHKIKHRNDRELKKWNDHLVKQEIDLVKHELDPLEVKNEQKDISECDL